MTEPHPTVVSNRLVELLSSQLVHLAPDGLVVVDEGGTVLLVNRQLTALFGYEADELVGEPIEVLVPGALRAVHQDHRSDFAADPRVRPMSPSGQAFLGQRKDGSQVPVEISLSPMRMGCRTVVVAAVRDATDRLAKESEARAVRQLLDDADDAMLTFDRETLRFTYANEEAVRQLGYSRDELLGMTQLQVKSEPTETAYRHVIEELAPGESNTFPAVHRRKDGRLIDVEVKLQRPAADATDGPSRWLLSVSRDVSRRAEAERRLRQTETDLAVLDDRQRIARDLHDRVIQRLFSTGLAASSISRRIADPVVAQQLEQVVGELDATIVDLRSSIFQLNSPEPRRPLPQRVLELCHAECEALGIASNVRFAGLVDTVDSAQAEELLAVLREALANVGRHARASVVEVALVVDGDITLRVEDDGVGIPSNDGDSTGSGLHNMATRARLLGGTFEVANGTPSGTRVEWRVPGGGGATVHGQHDGSGPSQGPRRGAA